MLPVLRQGAKRRSGERHKEYIYMHNGISSRQVVAITKLCIYIISHEAFLDCPKQQPSYHSD